MSTGAQAQPTQTTTPQLSDQQKQLLSAAMPGLTGFAANPPQQYQGQTVADFTPAQKAAQDQALQAATAQSNTANLGTGAENFFTGGQVWDPTYNPALQGAVDAAVRPIQQNWTDVVAPGIRNSPEFVGQNFGSSREGIATGIGAGRTAQAIGDTTSKMLEDLYKTNQSAQLQALGLLPTVQAAQAQPALTTGAVGDTQQAEAQAKINAEIQKFNYSQWAPFLSSATLAQIAGSLPGEGATSTANVPPPPDMWKQVLAGGATGAAAGSLLGPIGTGVGAVGGAALPFLLNR